SRARSNRAPLADAPPAAAPSGAPTRRGFAGSRADPPCVARPVCRPQGRADRDTSCRAAGSRRASPRSRGGGTGSQPARARADRRPRRWARYCDSRAGPVDTGDERVEVLRVEVGPRDLHVSRTALPHDTVPNEPTQRLDEARGERGDPFRHALREGPVHAEAAARHEAVDLDPRTATPPLAAQ